MAVRPSDAVGRRAVERARVRMPGLAPDSVEVVELVRGHAHVVIRSKPAGILVLDEQGRVVRGRARLAEIGRHVRTLELVRRALSDARIDVRLEQEDRSAELLAQLESVVGRTPGGARIADVRNLAERFRVALDSVRGEERRGLPPTERTLRRTIALVNDSARADRRVIRAVRLLAADLAAAGRLRPDSSDRVGLMLLRWLTARLETPDIPFVFVEFDEPRESRDIAAFVAAARA